MIPINPPIMWVFGKICSGKTTIARELALQLQVAGGYKTRLIDGDEFRAAIHPSLGFTKKDREINITRAIEFAVQLSKQGTLPVCAFVTPYKSMRDIIKEKAEAIPIYFIHVLCSNYDLLLGRRQVRGDGWEEKGKQADRVFKIDINEISSYLQIDTSGNRWETEAKKVFDFRKLLEVSPPSFWNCHGGKK